MCCIAFVAVFKMSEFCANGVTLVLFFGEMCDNQLMLTSVVDVSCLAVGVRLSNWSGKW